MDEYYIWDRHETHLIMCVHVCLCVMMSFWRVSHVWVWSYLMCVSYVHEWVYIWPIRTRHTWCEWAHIWADTHHTHMMNQDIYDCIHIIWMRGWCEMMSCTLLLKCISCHTGHVTVSTREWVIWIRRYRWQSSITTYTCHLIHHYIHMTRLKGDRDDSVFTLVMCMSCHWGHVYWDMWMKR